MKVDSSAVSQRMPGRNTWGVAVGRFHRWWWGADSRIASGVTLAGGEGSRIALSATEVAVLLVVDLVVVELGGSLNNLSRVSHLIQTRARLTGLGTGGQAGHRKGWSSQV